MEFILYVFMSTYDGSGALLDKQEFANEKSCIKAKMSIERSMDGRIVTERFSKSIRVIKKQSKVDKALCLAKGN